MTPSKYIQKVLYFPIKTITPENTLACTSDTFVILQTKRDIRTNNYLIYRAYLTQRLNNRQGTANTLTRGEVKGGGRKPWRQKGTGRARAGSNRSPLWKGGGVSFGPKTKEYSNKLNRKEWRLGLRILLISKEKNITIVEDFNSFKGKTTDMIKGLHLLNIKPTEKTLIIVPNLEKRLIYSTQNLNTIKVQTAKNLNFNEILIAKNLVISKDSLKIIEETYND
uniref:Large ribosomal subunit protein uL4c n=1 Tax=Phaeophyceae sp. TaxID=2249243 RepID=A0A8E5F7C7_9PHAE|nr:ribosomal protein L4 [Phaeophyceae sp.]